jgi:hypothetical protein
MSGLPRLCVHRRGFDGVDRRAACQRGGHPRRVVLDGAGPRDVSRRTGERQGWCSGRRTSIDRSNRRASGWVGSQTLRPPHLPPSWTFISGRGGSECSAYAVWSRCLLWTSHWRGHHKKEAVGDIGEVTPTTPVGTRSIMSDRAQYRITVWASRRRLATAGMGIRFARLELICILLHFRLQPHQQRTRCGAQS